MMEPTEVVVVHDQISETLWGWNGEQWRFTGARQTVADMPLWIDPIGQEASHDGWTLDEILATEG
jgi:hypothetical protein